MNFILKASLWQPGLQIAGGGKIEDTTVSIRVKGMMSECCSKEVLQLVTSIGVRDLPERCASSCPMRGF